MSQSSIEQRIAGLSEGLARLHASPWLGLIEEVGTGSWIQALTQSLPGASATLRAGRSSYAREVQEQLYGRQGRSVSAQAVEAWARANLQPRPDSFSLAISGAVASPLQRGDAHAWIALATGDGRGWTLHARCRAPDRLAQQLSLGELGVRLLIQLADGAPDFNALISPELQIDVWQAWHEPALQSCLAAGGLVQSGATPLALLTPASGIPQPRRYLDVLRGRRLLLHKGSFNPVTRAHLSLPRQVLARDPELLPVLELSLDNADKAGAGSLNSAHRLMMLSLDGQSWPLALTRTPALYQTRELFTQQAQAAQVDFVCGEDLYRRVFLARYYQNLPGGIDEGLQRLFANGTRLWVCGRQTDLDFPPEAQALAAAYAGQIEHLELDLPLASSAVRTAIAAGEPGWQSQLTPGVAAYIEQEGVYAGPSS